MKSKAELQAEYDRLHNRLCEIEFDPSISDQSYSKIEAEIEEKMAAIAVRLDKAE